LGRLIAVARPKKAPEERRSERITVRVTPAEKRAVELEADKSSIHHVEFSRRAILGQRVSVQPDSVKAAKSQAADMLLAVNELVMQTKRVGNNVNQLALSSHRDSHFIEYWQQVGDELETHLKHMQTIMDEVAETL